MRFLLAPFLWWYASYPNTMRWHWAEQAIQPYRIKLFGGGCGKLGCRPYMGSPNKGYWCHQCERERSPAYEAWMAKEMEQFGKFHIPA